MLTENRWKKLLDPKSSKDINLVLVAYFSYSDNRSQRFQIANWMQGLSLLMVPVRY